MILTIEEAIKELQKGNFLIVTDDQSRENEGDLILPAQYSTPEKVNFIISKARGLLCVAMEKERADKLKLTPMTSDNTSLHHTNFTVSVDAAEGTTTGISASDRSVTIQKLADDNSQAEDFGRPGHIFPLIAMKGGVLRRAGHTEAVVDLMKIAGLTPVGALCEILDEEGNAARMPALEKLSHEHKIGIVTIENLISYRHKTEKLVKEVLKTKLPSKYGMYDLYLFTNAVNDKIHLALVKGDITSDEPVLTRVHDECLTGDILGSMRCDCGEQLEVALKKIEEEGRGVLLYMRQEGRGIGLVQKLHAYVLQDQGYDTVEANIKLGHKADERDYGIGAQILSALGVKKMRLMTNNPRKIVGLSAFNLEIVERIPIQVRQNEYNTRYLKTKVEKMGHLIEESESWSKS